VRTCSFSVVSQCVFYHHCRPVMARMFPHQTSLDAAGIEKLADHISRFSLAALKAFTTKKK
jgi:TetR/AcrR family transcriptional regulator, regulator of cefoperazone and chloramphenicol sensitivity